MPVGKTGAFTDEALLELLLSYALNRGKLQPVARKLIQEFGAWIMFRESIMDESKLVFWSNE